LRPTTFAGDLAGVSMDEITAATKKLTLKLSDAAGGTGTAVAALQRLHLTYWIGIRHSSTAILSAWASTATPDLNGGTPVTTARKVLRRTLAYATAAPGTWGYLASETNAGPGTAIWMRSA